MKVIQKKLFLILCFFCIYSFLVIAENDEFSVLNQNPDYDEKGFEYVEEEELNSLERSFADTLLSDVGNRPENFDFLTTQYFGYLDERRNPQSKLKWNYYDNKQNKVIRLPIEKKEEIEARAKKGRAFRLETYQKFSDSFEKDSTDRRTKIFNKVDRALSLLALEDITVKQGEKPPTEIEANRIAMEKFRTRYRRYPDPTNSEDQRELGRLSYRAAEESVIGAKLDFKDNFKKRKELKDGELKTNKCLKKNSNELIVSLKNLN